MSRLRPYSMSEKYVIAKIIDRRHSFCQGRAIFSVNIRQSLGSFPERGLQAEAQVWTVVMIAEEQLQRGRSMCVHILVIAEGRSGSNLPARNTSLQLWRVK